MWKPAESWPVKAIAFPSGDQAAPPTSTPSGQPEAWLVCAGSPITTAKSAMQPMRSHMPQRGAFAFGIGNRGGR
jgi:hypothetical protein